jgi:hypothetical protein
MTPPPQPTEPFPQHPRLAELVTALGFRRYLLFLTGLLCEEPGGLLHHRFPPQGPARWPSPAPRSSGLCLWRLPTPCWTSSAGWPTAMSAASWWSMSWSCLPRADPGRFTMWGAAEGS